MEAFEQLTFKIPSYDLQVKIGHTLSLLQNQLDTAFATKQAYHQQKQYLLSQMFIWTSAPTGSVFASWTMPKVLVLEIVCFPFYQAYLLHVFVR